MLRKSKGLLSNRLEKTVISILMVSNSDAFKSGNSNVKVLSHNGEKVFIACSVFFVLFKTLTTAKGFTYVCPLIRVTLVVIDHLLHKDEL